VLPAWPIAPPGGWNSTVDKGFPLLFFLKKEGRRQPVRWSRPPAPTSAVYQKEKEKTRERRSLRKLLYMHYPKSRTTGAASCMGGMWFFYNGGEGERRPQLHPLLFSRREKIPKKGSGWGSNAAVASFSHRRQAYKHLFTLHYYLLHQKRPPCGERFSC